MPEQKDYDVGYGKPPKRTQFKKGQSGNPKGRPKGAKGFNASLKRELESKVIIQEGGRRLKVSKAEAGAKRLIAKALAGDMAALKMLAMLDAELHAQVEQEANQAMRDTGPDQTDENVLSHFKEQWLAQAADCTEAVEPAEEAEPDEGPESERQDDPGETVEPIYAEDVEDPVYAEDAEEPVYAEDVEEYET
ncbi:hypothetical protein BXY66_0292 [Shimia isoporae]|uniref:DUF5681 domain-containing protein n=1 Tax=Shimia isoporae TaxID=647720 RepID=A0A4R1NJ49_9RHOB|nr:DUF5681 domain-containing protein [Shimia isoporae]TCL08257.1 hypothetical protein BXY66_0292 [Shimia isoporae]